mmetsp:Transcript_20675/g.50792  ORF Transcript_20675/g.50792 Transcript_20675/m.50792 type:complete len:229 (-) Transcript_20675:785-1471(-)
MGLGNHSFPIGHQGQESNGNEKVNHQMEQSIIEWNSILIHGRKDKGWTPRNDKGTKVVNPRHFGRLFLGHQDGKKSILGRVEPTQGDSPKDSQNIRLDLVVFIIQYKDSNRGNDGKVKHIQTPSRIEIGLVDDVFAQEGTWNGTNEDNQKDNSRFRSRHFQYFIEIGHGTNGKGIGASFGKDQCQQVPSNAVLVVGVDVLGSLKDLRESSRTKGFSFGQYALGLGFGQ